MKDEFSFENLNFREIRGPVDKDISYAPNLSLDQKIVKITNNISILDKKSNLKDVSFLADYLEESHYMRNIPGTIFKFKYKKDPKWHYEGITNIDNFLSAVSIYSNVRIRNAIHFSVKDTKKGEYYRPYDFLDKNKVLFRDEDRFHIKDRKDLNNILKIYDGLQRSKYNDHGKFNRLKNSAMFYNRFLDEEWTLLKTMFAFVSLESLFSDNGGETTYKVAIRAAHFLYPNDSQKRKDIFDFIKKGYSIRSKFVHGSDAGKEIKKSMKALEKGRDLKHGYYDFRFDFSKDLGHIISDCLKKIFFDEKYLDFFSKENRKSEDENDFFKKIVL